MSPAKKPPRPVTAWFIDYGDGTIGCDSSPTRRFQRDIRCRVTPLRPATDSEIERLARKLYDDCSTAARGRGVKDVWRFRDLDGEIRERWLSFARAAWKRGAR